MNSNVLGKRVVEGGVVEKRTCDSHQSDNSPQKQLLLCGSGGNETVGICEDSIKTNRSLSKRFKNTETLALSLTTAITYKGRYTNSPDYETIDDIESTGTHQKDCIDSLNNKTVPLVKEGNTSNSSVAYNKKKKGCCDKGFDVTNNLSKITAANSIVDNREIDHLKNSVVESTFEESRHGTRSETSDNLIKEVEEVSERVSVNHSLDSTEKNSNSTNRYNTGDELGLCIDMMAARIRELELERERIKLDVIVALRKQFENVKNSGGDLANLRDGGLDDNLCNIAIEEVEKCRSAELEKQAEMKADYERKLKDLTSQLSFVEKEKSQLLDELEGNKKASDSRLDEKQGKLDRVQSRVSYLESLLKTIEKDNTKLKQNVDTTETQLSQYQAEGKSLQNQLDELHHQLEVSRNTDSKMKEFYEREHAKMSNEHKSVKDQLADVEIQLANSKQEREKLLNSKETDTSIIRHLEDKLKRQGTLLDTMSTDSNKYFELNMKLESKAAEYKQKLKKSVYGIESTQEENKRLKKERDSLDNDKAQLQRDLNEVKRRENHLLFQIKKLTAESEQKKRELDIFRDRYNGRFTAAIVPTHDTLTTSSALRNNDASYAVLGASDRLMNKTWNDDTLGPVITSSIHTEHAPEMSRVGANLNMSPSNGSSMKRSPLKKLFLMESPNRRKYNVDASPPTALTTTYEDGLVLHGRSDESLSYNNNNITMTTVSKPLPTVARYNDSLSYNNSRSLATTSASKASPADHRYSQLYYEGADRENGYHTDRSLKTTTLSANGLGKDYSSNSKTTSQRRNGATHDYSSSDASTKMNGSSIVTSDSKKTKTSINGFSSHNNGNKNLSEKNVSFFGGCVRNSRDENNSLPLKSCVRRLSPSTNGNGALDYNNATSLSGIPRHDAVVDDYHLPSTTQKQLFVNADTSESGFEGSPVNGFTSPNKSWLVRNGDSINGHGRGRTSPLKHDSIPGVSRNFNQRNTKKYFGDETK